MADTGAGRHDLEIVESVRAPFEEFVALAVARIFKLDVLAERPGVAELVDHHAVVDHQIDRDQRIDLLRIAAELRHRVAHRCQVDDRRHAGEVLHQNARRPVLDLARDGPFFLPVDHRLEVFAGHRLTVLEAQQILEQHLHRERQARNVAELPGRLGQRIISVGLQTDGQRRARAEAVLAGWDHRSSFGLRLRNGRPRGP